ncbi:MAG: hypothetical protein CMN44_02315 [SAR116 cluster bacterium]|nr:hypothetical protein [SAR116 cluster bacterium]RPH11372.1 MAG: hypothetical protein CBC14_002290 [Alphaproteobacteria bacterium TMED54]
MTIDLLLQNFEIILISLLLIIVILSVAIFFIQNKFINTTNNKIDAYHNQIKKNNSELAEYLNTLSKILEINKQKTEQLILSISDIEKNLSSMKTIKGNDDLLTLAIDLARSGSTKDEIKNKTGLNDEEIETIYAYHKNVRT